MPCVLVRLPKPPAVGSDSLDPAAELSSQLRHSTGTARTLSSASRDAQKETSNTDHPNNPSSSVEKM